MTPDRFWSRVDRSGGPDACWAWTGGRQKGYGRLNYAGRPYLAHRLAVELTVGREPAAFVCHHCDNPPCCNPAHLFEGTNADNMADKVAKGRQARGATHGDLVRGELHTAAKLTDEQVLSVRQRRSEGIPQKDLAAELGVSRQVINDIVRGRRWKHVGGPVSPSRRRAA